MNRHLLTLLPRLLRLPLPLLALWPMLLAGAGAGAAEDAGGAPQPPPAVLRIVVDSSTAMPMSQIESGIITHGIHRDIGMALARELGARAEFSVLPRKRIGVVLEQGDSDLSCHYLPQWLPAQVDWSVPFMPNATVLVSALHARAPATIEDLRNVPVGTVLGFAYPEMQQALGSGFVRDEASDAMQNLTKFAAGRTRHALAGEVFFNYQQRLHPNLLQVHRPLVLNRYEARCAVSRRSRFSLARIDAAILALQQRGRIAAIYASYRPGPGGKAGIHRPAHVDR